MNDGLQGKRRAEWPGQSVDGNILNWLFHCGIPVWNHTLLLSIVEVNKQGGTYQKYSLMTEVEEMSKVPAMEIGSISVGDGL